MPASYIYGFCGGLFIGLAAVLLFWFNGRIMGVSGIVSRLLWKPGKDFFWRLAFVLGLIAGGWAYQQKFHPLITVAAGPEALVTAGFLVGLGTVLANGCTSGHGICGIARFSKRSITATAVFMAAGILTVWVKRLVVG